MFASNCCEDNTVNLIVPGISVEYGTAPPIGNANFPLAFCTLSFKKIET